jgi:hypothetical protein
LLDVHLSHNWTMTVTKHSTSILVQWRGDTALKFEFTYSNTSPWFAVDCTSCHHVGVFYFILEFSFSWWWPWRVLYWGMWHHIIWYKFTYDLEECTTSIFGVEEWANKAPSRAVTLLAWLTHQHRRWRKYILLKQSLTYIIVHSSQCYGLQYVFKIDTSSWNAMIFMVHM